MSFQAPGRHWSGVFLFLFLFSLSAFSFATCRPSGELQSARLDRVIDGDTLRLSNGRHVRLAGVNTPEMGRDGAPDQPLAKDAARAVREWLGESLLLDSGVESQDRYGRHLASVFRASDRASLGEYLLAQGLAWQVVVPPNLEYRSCLARAEAGARQVALGVWTAYSPDKVSALTAADSGFRRVFGRVSRIASSRKALWIELDDALSLRVDQRDFKYFGGFDFQSLAGKELTLRGWLIYRSKTNSRYPAHMMQWRHPSMLELVED